MCWGLTLLLTCAAEVGLNDLVCVLQRVSKGDSKVDVVDLVAALRTTPQPWLLYEM
jgi:hypothetical protein